MTKLSKSTPANFSKIHIVDWGLIESIDPMVLKVTNDRKSMKKIVKNFLHANALFKDPSFCPPELVLKYFQILQVSVSELINENNQLRESLNEKTQEARKTKLKLQQSQTIQLQEKAKTQTLPKTIFQCPFCPKAYYTQHYVHKHIAKDHQEDVNKLTKSAPVPKRRLKSSKQSKEDIDALRGELQAMFDKFDTTTRQEQEQQYVRYSKRFRTLEQKIDNLGQNDKFKKPLIKRKDGLMNSYAIYSSDQNSGDSSSESKNGSDKHINDQENSNRIETTTLGEGTIDTPSDSLENQFVIGSSHSFD